LLNTRSQSTAHTQLAMPVISIVDLVSIESVRRDAERSRTTSVLHGIIGRT
jgi:hypothetical protein